MSRKKQNPRPKLRGKKAVASQRAAPTEHCVFNHELLRLRRNCAWRPIDWRWQRANLLLESGEPAGPGDDEAVGVILQFLREQRGQLDSSSTAVSDDTKARIQHAYEIHQANRMPRWAMDAWLLTGAPLEVVGRETGQELELVEWYAAAFFDIGERITAPSFVMHQIIGPKFYDAMTAADVGIFWMHIGYMMGPGVLALFIDDFVEAGRDDYSYVIDGSFDRVSLPEMRWMMHQIIRVKLLPADDAKAIVDAYLNILKSERQQPTGASTIVQQFLVLVNPAVMHAQDSAASPDSRATEPVEAPSEEDETHDAA